MNSAAFDTWLAQAHRSPLLMGVLNVTPDSFSDGGKHDAPRAAIEHGLRMLAEGAAIIDVGGESTRPGSQPVRAEEQIRRTIPVIRELSKSAVTISIDTTSADVARAAIDAGATIINDISAGRFDAEMLPLAADRGVAIVLMHMQGTPQTMQTQPAYADVVSEVIDFLNVRARAAMEAGVDRRRVLLDVGIGFGKTLTHNLQLLRHHQRIADLGFATVLGTSRKGFIGTLTGRTDPADRIMGTAAANAWGLAKGADILRVHDVAEMRDVMAVVRAIREVE